MRFIKKEFIEYLNTLQKMEEQNSAIINILDMSPDWGPGEWINNYCNLFFDMCFDEDSTEQFKDFVIEYVGYYLYEIECGKKADENPVIETLPDGTEKKYFIRNAEDLYDYIMNSDF